MFHQFLSFGSLLSILQRLCIVTLSAKLRLTVTLTLVVTLPSRMLSLSLSYSTWLSLREPPEVLATLAAHLARRPRPFPTPRLALTAPNPPYDRLARDAYFLW